MQPISYRGRVAAVATPTRFLLADDLDARDPGDPERTWVTYMCVHAGDVLNGVMPGPYTDERARLFAAACLIPAELVERDGLDVDRAARALGVPAGELLAARAAQVAA